MPATINGGGDQLASGAVRCTFRNANVSKERWAEIFGDDSGPKLNISGGDTNGEPSGTVSANTGKISKRKKRS